MRLVVWSAFACGVGLVTFAACSGTIGAYDDDTQQLSATAPGTGGTGGSAGTGGEDDTGGTAGQGGTAAGSSTGGTSGSGGSSAGSSGGGNGGTNTGGTGGSGGAGGNNTGGTGGNNTGGTGGNNTGGTGGNNTGGTGGNNTGGTGGNNTGGTGGVGTPSGECKRGIAYGHHSTADLAIEAPRVHWWYNWSSGPDQGINLASTSEEYVPMLWNGGFNVNNVINQIKANPKAKYLLTFNEPDFTNQANLTPSAAAAKWPQVEQIADATGLKIVGPGMNYCGGGCNETDPFVWLDKFFAACTNCRVDYIAFHWYNCDLPSLQTMVGRYAKYGKPLWLTEFSCLEDKSKSGSVAEQQKYMSAAVPYLESESRVFRYSWFTGRWTGDAISLLGSSGQLTALGKTYLSLPEACNP